MFKLSTRIFARATSAATQDHRAARLSCGNAPFSRRHSAMIAPRIWRRRGPILNLHDRLGAATAGARREKPRNGRIGMTFWHRPYRSAI